MYSNEGYSVLAAVVERASGQALEEYLQQRLFKPLGMLRTGYQFAPTLRDSIASPVMDGRMGAPISDRIAAMGRDYWNLKGNGGMQASTDDMYTWFRSLRARREAGDSLARALFAPRVRRDSTVWYGYGFFIRTGADGELEQASHTGSDGTFFSAIVWRPRDATFYYLVTSSGERTGAALAGGVLKRLRESR
jgi:CubicO group peptidase (beta-lactamase class C family)